jgi:hypothetical protein
VALIPTDPYAAATMPVPYAGGAPLVTAAGTGSKYQDATMVAFVSKAGGLGAYGERLKKPEPHAVSSSGGGGKMSGGAVAGLVIGLCALIACVAWLLVARSRDSGKDKKQGVKKQRRLPYSTDDADVDFAEAEAPSRSSTSRTSGSSGFQPARNVGRFAGNGVPVGLAGSSPLGRNTRQ